MVALQNKQNIVLEGGWPGGAGDSILTTRQATEKKYFILHVILINELRIYQEYYVIMNVIMNKACHSQVNFTHVRASACCMKYNLSDHLNIFLFI